MPLRIDWTTENVAEAIYYAVDNGARVISMSFGSFEINKYGPDSIVEEAVNYAYRNGVNLVATAGNSNWAVKRYPAALGNVTAVTATDNNDIRSKFSSYGYWVDVAAPGTGILTTAPGSKYASVSGTSFSAPFISGVIGLVASKNPSLTPFETRTIVEYTGDKLDSDFFIGPRANVFNALSWDSIPNPVALIKSPYKDFMKESVFDVYGTALGDDYIVEYKHRNSNDWIKGGSGTQTINNILATVNILDIQDGFYDIKLTVTNNNGEIDSDQSEVFFDTFLYENWPFDAGSPLYNPSFYDIDGDLDMEIFVGDGLGRVHAWHHDGTLVSGWPIQTVGSYIISSPAIGDMDNDGEVEIVWTKNSNNQIFPYLNLFAYNLDGTPVSGWPIALTPGQKFRYVSIDDVDLDGSLDVVTLGSGLGSADLYLIGANGKLKWSFNLSIYEKNVQNSPAIGDIDGDGDKEIVVSSWTKSFLFDYNGNLMNGWPISGGSHSSPIIADLNGDGNKEIVVHAGPNVQVLNYTGNILKGWPRGVASDNSYSQLSLGDINNDGKLEIFIGNGIGDIYAWHHDGTLVSGWPVHAASDEILGQIAIADVAGDDNMEVIATSEDSGVYILNNTGVLIDGLSRLTSGQIFGGVIVGDFDGDGKVEVGVGTLSGSFYVWNFPASFSNSKVDWGIYQSDIEHSGCFECNPDQYPVYPSCNGNGIIDQGEKCDDGNIASGDGCGYYCQIERGWECNGAPSNCQIINVCGDGIASGSEECDGSDFRGKSCIDIGFDSGTLACDSQCNLVINSCVGNPCLDNNHIYDPTQQTCMMTIVVDDSYKTLFERSLNKGWDVAHDASCSSFILNKITIQNNFVSARNYSQIYRAFVPFDTSFLEGYLNGRDIVDAKLTMYVSNTLSSGTKNPRYIAVVDSGVLSDSKPSFSSCNYGGFGNEELSSQVLWDGSLAGKDVVFNLNSAGVGFIKTNSWTNFGLRGSFDLLDVFDGNIPADDNIFVGFNYTGIGRVPRLGIYYEPFY